MLSGLLAGVPGGSISLVSGTVRLPGATYRIRPASGGGTLLSKSIPRSCPGAAGPSLDEHSYSGPGWCQINGILGNYALGTTRGYFRVQKSAGNNPFLACGVIKDGGTPGQRSDNGA